MKRKLLIAISMLLCSAGFAQTTATNFNCNDCAATNHDLFTELDAGKVIVMVWVMPCSACISPSRTAYDAVQTYATSNPGRVLFYLVDDYANTNCTTLTSWANTNAMPTAVTFSNALINPADYGNVGMPKIVVLGGLSHTIYYNEDDGANLAGIKPAIDSALAATGIEENNTIVSSLNVFHNSENNVAIISYNLKAANSVSFEIIDITGKNIKTIAYTDQVAGKHEIQIDLANLSKGVYILKLNTGGTSRIVKFFI